MIIRCRGKSLHHEKTFNHVVEASQILKKNIEKKNEVTDTTNQTMAKK